MLFASQSMINLGQCRLCYIRGIAFGPVIAGSAVGTIIISDSFVTSLCAASDASEQKGEGWLCLIIRWIQ